MNLGWKKMIANKVLSNISHQKLVSHQKKIKFDVKLSNAFIFSDLGMVFKHIGGYRRLFIKLFEDMDKFKFTQASSVTTADILPSMYGEINLYDHTLNTFKQMLKAIDDNSANKEILLLLALLHDFGKSELLCENYKITKEEKHWVRSSLYFKQIIENDSFFFDLDETGIHIIRYILSIHHDSLLNSTEQQNRYLLELKKADKAARDLEKLLLEKAV